MCTCVVGVPKERKFNEGRVGMTPALVSEVRELGGAVLIETGAGVLSGFSDEQYENAGAIIVKTPDEVWCAADIVVKVKEPIREEYRHLSAMSGKTLFTYLHLAGSEIELTRALLRYEITAIAYETVSEAGNDGRMTFPLLLPMSKIAGTQAMRTALSRHQPEEFSKLIVMIIGAGNVGEAALRCAIASDVGFVVLFEPWEPRALELKEKYGSDKVVIFPLSMLGNEQTKNYLKVADIFISAPMLPGGKEAPIVLTQKHFRLMKNGAYISDVSIDQGGSTAWTKDNSTKPGETFTRGMRNLVFSAVPNIPGSTVPEEATRSLCAATKGYLLGMVGHQLASHNGDYTVLRDNLSLRMGLQTWRGLLTNEYVMRKHGLISDYCPLDEIF